MSMNRNLLDSILKTLAEEKKLETGLTPAEQFKQSLRENNLTRATNNFPPINEYDEVNNNLFLEEYNKIIPLFKTNIQAAKTQLEGLIKSMIDYVCEGVVAKDGELQNDLAKYFDGQQLNDKQRISFIVGILNNMVSSNIVNVVASEMYQKQEQGIEPEKVMMDGFPYPLVLLSSSYLNKMTGASEGKPSDAEDVACKYVAEWFESKGHKISFPEKKQDKDSKDSEYSQRKNKFLEESISRPLTGFRDLFEEDSTNYCMFEEMLTEMKRLNVKEWKELQKTIVEKFTELLSNPEFNHFKRYLDMIIKYVQSLNDVPLLNKIELFSVANEEEKLYSSISPADADGFGMIELYKKKLIYSLLQLESETKGNPPKEEYCLDLGKRLAKEFLSSHIGEDQYNLLSKAILTSDKQILQKLSSQYLSEAKSIALQGAGAAVVPPPPTISSLLPRAPQQATVQSGFRGFWNRRSGLTKVAIVFLILAFVIAVAIISAGSGAAVAGVIMGAGAAAGSAAGGGTLGTVAAIGTVAAEAGVGVGVGAGVSYALARGVDAVAQPQRPQQPVSPPSSPVVQHEPVVPPPRTLNAGVHKMVGVGAGSSRVPSDTAASDKLKPAVIIHAHAQQKHQESQDPENKKNSPRC